MPPDTVTVSQDALLVAVNGTPATPDVICTGTCVGEVDPYTPSRFTEAGALDSVGGGITTRVTGTCAEPDDDENVSVLVYVPAARPVVFTVTVKGTPVVPPAETTSQGTGDVAVKGT